MNHSNQLIEIYKAHLSLASNTAIGERLGVKQQTVSMWVHGKSHPNAEAIAAMCKATGEPLARWLPLIEAERCRTEADRKVWLRLAQMAAAVTLAVGLHPAHAAVSQRIEAGFSNVPSIHYAH